MFWWRPPPSSGKSTAMNQTTAVVSCLFYHAHRFTLINAQLAEHRSAALLKLSSTGNQEIRSWHLHNTWHILGCVRVRACACLCCAYHNINKRVHACTHTHTHTNIWTSIVQVQTPTFWFSQCLTHSGVLHIFV